MVSQRPAAMSCGVIDLPSMLKSQPPSLKTIRGAMCFRSSGKRSIQQSVSSMWLSAEMIRVLDGQSRVAACGLRRTGSGRPSCSGISRTNPSAIASSSARTPSRLPRDPARPEKILTHSNFAASGQHSIWAHVAGRRDACSVPGMRYWLLILVAFLQIAAAPMPPKDAAPPRDVSLIALIANPAAHDGELVRVTGFLNLEFEGSGLYTDRTAFDAMQTRDAVWIEKPERLDEQRSLALTGRYALVEGRFNARNNGHMGLYSGAIEKVARLEPQVSRAELRDDLPMSREPLWLGGLLIAGLVAGAIVWMRRRRSERPTS